MSQEFKLKILLGLYISALLGANLLGSKVATVWGLTFSVGLLCFPFTFLITDIVEEIKGKNEARQFFFTALICVLVILGYSTLFVNLPPADRFVQNNDSYATIFGQSIRIMIASVIAFGLSQLHDIWAFGFIKEQTQGRFLWLRNNGSTIVSQFIDTLIFYSIAFIKLPFAIPFLGIELGDGYDLDFIWQIFWPYFGLKVLAAIFDTPLVYAGVYWLGLKKDLDTKN